MQRACWLVNVMRAENYDVVHDNDIDDADADVDNYNREKKNTQHSVLLPRFLNKSLKQSDEFCPTENPFMSPGL